MKRTLSAVLLTLAAWLLSAQTTTIAPQTLPDITGDGAAHAISATAQQARWVSIYFWSTNSGTGRVGGASISSSQGTPVAAGWSFFWPSVSSGGGGTTTYNLQNLYYIVQSGDKASIQYAR